MYVFDRRHRKRAITRNLVVTKDTWKSSQPLMTYSQTRATVMVIFMEQELKIGGCANSSFTGIYTGPHAGSSKIEKLTYPPTPTQTQPKAPRGCHPPRYQQKPSLLLQKILQNKQNTRRRRMMKSRWFLLLLLAIIVNSGNSDALEKRVSLVKSSKLPPISRKIIFRGGADTYSDNADAHFEEITAIKRQSTSGKEVLTTEENSNNNASTSRLLAFLGSSVQRIQWLQEKCSNNLVANALKQSCQTIGQHSDRLLSSLIPALVAAFCQKPLSLIRLYALALVGSSVGFVHYVYFISVGYAWGVAFPVLVGILLTRPQGTTLMHSLLVAIWGIRLSAHLLWREFVNWPALHEKIVYMSARQSPTLSEKLVGWAFYSILYVCLLSPCWWRLQQRQQNVVVGTRQASASLALQVTGLLLESVADWQKSAFKAQDGNRYEWCHVGVWRIFPQANYLGEWLFWLGTFAGAPILSRSTSTMKVTMMLQLLMSSIGLIFASLVLWDAAKSLSQRQAYKYMDNADFQAYRASRTLWGPKIPSSWRPQSKEQKEEPLLAT